MEFDFVNPTVTNNFLNHHHIKNLLRYIVSNLIPNEQF